MTAPSIEVQDSNKVTGNGLAIVGVVIEQDAAYWEASIDCEAGTPDDLKFQIMAGVATKKDRKFYSSLNGIDDEQGTENMRMIEVRNGDTIGVAVQQADLPMVQFLLNGEPLHDLSINRFRGLVYPAVYLSGNDGLGVRFVFDESNFQEMSPHPRIGPLIEARGLV